MKKFILLTLMVSLYIPSFASITSDKPSVTPFDNLNCGGRGYLDSFKRCNEAYHELNHGECFDSDKGCCHVPLPETDDQESVEPKEFSFQEAIQNLNKKIDDLQDTVNALQQNSYKQQN